MVVSPSVITVAKYGFLSLVFTGAGFLIGNVIVVKHQEAAEFADSLVYHPHGVAPAPGRSVLDANFGRCLTDPATAPHCPHVTPRSRRKRRRRDILDGMEFTTPSLHAEPSKDTIHPLHNLLLDFGKLMSSLGLHPVLLEPSMLYCLLSPPNKLHLIKKGFNPHALQGSENIVTVGIFEKEVQLLHQDTNQIANFNFTISNYPVEEHLLLPSHYFFTRMGLTVHGVVLFEKHGFLWNDDINREDEGMRDLLLIKESAYENFTSVPLPVENSPHLVLSLPSSPIQFLHQLSTSKFIGCVPEVSTSSVDHPTLSPLQLRNRVVVCLQELKAVLKHYLVNFWLWMETLKGWNLNCNIFSITSELNIAVSYVSIREINLTSVLAGNDYLKIIPEFQLPDESFLKENTLAKVTFDCYGLKINIFICFEEKDSIWSYVSPETDTSYRTVYPDFRLCTTEVYGQRVNVPCRNNAIEDINTEVISRR